MKVQAISGARPFLAHGSARQEISAYGSILVLGLAAYLAMSRLDGDRGLVAVLIVTWSVALVGLNVVQGLTGYPSLSQAAFFGIGAYASSIALANGLPMWSAILVAMLVGVASGLLLAIVFSRTRGQYFAIGTLFFGAMCALIFTNETAVTGGAQGMPVALGIDVDAIVVLLAVSLVVVLAGFRVLAQSPLGAALLAIRQDEDLAEHLGVATSRMKLVSIVLACTIGTWAGVLFAQYNGVVAPAQFTYVQSFLMFVAIGVAGSGRLFAPVIGASVVVGLTQLLKLEPGLSQVVLGLIFVVITLIMPGGIIGGVESVWGWARARVSSRGAKQGALA